MHPVFVYRFCRKHTDIKAAHCLLGFASAVFLNDPPTEYLYEFMSLVPDTRPAHPILLRFTVLTDLILNSHKVHRFVVP